MTVYGNPVLRHRGFEVVDFDRSLRRLVEQLFSTMYATDDGVGLAANQIGRPERVFVFDCGDEMMGYVVNPVVHPLGDDRQDGPEGCLSLPGVSLPTTRYQQCRVEGRDVDGHPVHYEGDGLAARCFQHEVDHLDGRLYIDHHPDDVRTAVESDLRQMTWFGRDVLHPGSRLYRRITAGAEQT